MRIIPDSKKKFLFLFLPLIFLISCGPCAVFDFVSEKRINSEDSPLPIIQDNEETEIPGPSLGDFENPAHVGESVLRYESDRKDFEVEAVLLDVKRGAEAQELAQSLLDPLGYENPRPMFEYLALKVRLIVLDSSDGKEYSLFPIDHFGLRETQKGFLLWSVDTPARYLPEYSPVRDEGWIFFIVNEKYTPYLYFQPFLSLNNDPGFEEYGAYFVLE